MPGGPFLFHLQGPHLRARLPQKDDLHHDPALRPWWLIQQMGIISAVLVPAGHLLFLIGGGSAACPGVGHLSPRLAIRLPHRSRGDKGTAAARAKFRNRYRQIQGCNPCPVSASILVVFAMGAEAVGRIEERKASLRRVGPEHA